MRLSANYGLSTGMQKCLSDERLVYPSHYQTRGKLTELEMSGMTMRSNQADRPRKRLYTIKEAAEYLGRSPWAVRSMIWSGKLPAVRDSKWILLDVFDLDRWIEANKVSYAE